MQLKSILASAIVILLPVGVVEAGPIAYGLCQTGRFLLAIYGRVLTCYIQGATP